MKKILVVEDVEASRDLVVQLLEDDYEVIEAVNGEEAVALAEKEHPDLFEALGLHDIVDRDIIHEAWVSEKLLKACVLAVPQPQGEFEIVDVPSRKEKIADLERRPLKGACGSPETSGRFLTKDLLDLEYLARRILGHPLLVGGLAQRKPCTCRRTAVDYVLELRTC